MISGARNSGVPQSVYALLRSIFFANPKKSQTIYLSKIKQNSSTKITHFYIAMSIDEQIFRLNKKNQHR